MDLVEHAAVLRLERAVNGAGRAASIGRGRERFAAFALLVIADGEIAGQEIDLLPVVVHERRGGVDARVEAQQPRAATHLLFLVEVAREDLLLDARGVAGGRGPARIHVDAGEFEMRFVHRHRSSPAVIRVQAMCARDRRGRSCGHAPGLRARN